MVRSNTNYSIVKNEQEENHLETIAAKGLLMLAFLWFSKS